MNTHQNISFFFLQAGFGVACMLHVGVLTRRILNINQNELFADLFKSVFKEIINK